MGNMTTFTCSTHGWMHGVARVRLEAVPGSRLAEGQKGEDTWFPSPEGFLQLDRDTPGDQNLILNLLPAVPGLQQGPV